MKVTVPALFEGLRWQFCTKDFLETFTRPGVSLRTRFKAALGLLSQGYAGSAGGELAVRQVPSPRGEKTFRAVSPDDLRRFLLDLEVEAFRASGQELSRAERKARLVRGDVARKVLKHLELHDGTITRIRAEDPLAMLGLSFEQAQDAGLCVPIAKLEVKDKHKLNGKCFIFVHAAPRAASIQALTEPVSDEDSERAKTSRRQAAAATAELFHEVSAEVGVDADLLKSSPEFRREADRYVAMETRLQRDELAKTRQRLKLRSMAELIKRDRGSPTTTGIQKSLFPAPELEALAPQTSASLNPNGKDRKLCGGPDTPVASESSVSEAQHPPSRRDAESIPLVSQPRAHVSDAEAYQVLDTMRALRIPADLEGVRTILRRCRENAPGATAAQICGWAEALAPVARKKDSAFGYLIRYLPLKFAGADRPEPQRIEPARERGLEAARELWDVANEQERSILIESYPELAELRKAAHGD